MIELLRAPGSADSDWIEAALKELVLGYERREIALHEAPAPLPAIRHDGRLISGREQLLAYLEELEQLAHDWRRFQADACYIDDDGETC